MAEWVAITVLGQDRPGIVAGVSRVLFEHGCNIEDSSATILRDAFAMILIAKLPDPPRADELAGAVAATAAELGVTCDLRALGDAAPRREPTGTPYLLTVYGADQPGIVARVTADLADCQVNITDVSTRVSGLPERPIYIMLLDLSLPESASADELKARLTRLRGDLNVDITLRLVDEATF